MSVVQYDEHQQQHNGNCVNCQRKNAIIEHLRRVVEQMNGVNATHLQVGLFVLFLNVFVKEA
jgi:hypothetical protein